MENFHFQVLFSEPIFLGFFGIFLLNNILWFVFYFKQKNKIVLHGNNYPFSKYKIKTLENLIKTTSYSNREFLRSFMHEIRHSTMMSRNIKQMINVENLNEVDKKLIEKSEKEIKNISEKLESITEAFQWQSGEKQIQCTVGTLKDLFDFCLKDLHRYYPRIRSLVSIKMDYELGKKMFFYDPFSLKRMFVEIIKNGLFFNNNKDPKIKVSIVQNNDYIVFDIEDNGIGIKQENWNKVFELLWVGSFSRDENQSGLGTNLTVSQGIARAHGGEIKVYKSSIGHGSVFRVKLPLVEQKKVYILSD